VVTKDETLKLALEALTYIHAETSTEEDVLIDEAITAIKEALAQPAQEPVAWGVFEGNLHDLFLTQAEAQEMAELKGSHAKVQPLYTTPPQRPWVGLTGEETIDLAVKVGARLDLPHATKMQLQQQFIDALRKPDSLWMLFARDIEAKLKEKNT